MESIKCLDGVKHSEMLRIYAAVAEILEKNKEQKEAIVFDVEEAKNEKMSLLIYKPKTSLEELTFLKQKISVEGDVDVSCKGKGLLVIKIETDKKVFLSLVNKATSNIPPLSGNRNGIAGTGQKNGGII